MAVKQLDCVLFWKLIWLMDSPNDNERQRAMEQAARLCRAAGLRFGDALQQTFEQNGNGRVAELEAALKKAESCGDKLARELEKYRARSRWCGSCEIMRRVVAVVIGGAILAGWFYAYPPQQVTHRWSGYGLMLAAVPLLCLFLRWRVMCFKRRTNWLSWTNNDVFRAVANAWNGFLERFLIEV
jgi:hypothetical protein